jgi:hypothetical protein
MMQIMAEGVVKTMKRLLIFSALLALAMAGSLAAQSTLRREYRDLAIDVWTDHDTGSNYYEGDNVTIYFKTSQDAYVTIYDLDSRGNVNLIFPPSPTDNHLVQAGEVYQIPDPSADYTLTLEGPPGNENIQMVASTDYFPVPNWDGPVSVYDNDWGFKYDGDNEKFMDQINNKYFTGENFAYDHVGFYVAPKYYYQPDRADCSGDCGRAYIDYPDGCEVYVDGVFFGYAPLYMPGIYLGRHRVTVYWGTSVVYNDWIFVNAYDPFCVFPRPLFVYRYCYDNWYHHRNWDSYWGGPSHFKYKDRDFYSGARLAERRGYRIVDNDHGRYVRSKSYDAGKESRIADYKQKFGYDPGSRTFTERKTDRVDQGGRKYYNSGTVNTDKGRGVDNRGGYQGKPAGDAGRKDGNYGREGQGRKEQPGGTTNKGNVDNRRGDRPASGESKGSGVDNRKPDRKSGGDSKDQPKGRPESKDRQSSGSQGKPRSDNSQYYHYTRSDAADHVARQGGWNRWGDRPTGTGVTPNEPARPRVQERAVQPQPQANGNSGGRGYSAPENRGGSRETGSNGSRSNSGGGERTSGGGARSQGGGGGHSSGGGGHKR